VTFAYCLLGLRLPIILPQRNIVLMTSQEFRKQNIPDVPGVYLFLGPRKEILYIGKATSLRDRIRSYFLSDVIATRGRLIVDMVTKATDIDFIPTDSVLEALILEANLIKKHQPYYNTKEKDNRSYNHVIITDEDFPQVLVVRGRTLELAFPKNRIRYSFGPFPHGTQLREAMKIIRKLFPFRDNKCVPAFVRTQAGKPARPCFNYHIGLCPGVCTGDISKEEYAKTIRHLRLFFEGKKKELLRELEREMKRYAKAHEFEKAATVRGTMYALNHIQDVALLKRDTLQREYIAPVGAPEGNVEYRIEAYDIAHMHGTSHVGVMVVVEDGEVNKSGYRKFKIRTQRGANDTGALKEVLKRRLTHDEWPFPQLIVVDGGQAQINAALEILSEKGFAIPVVSVLKDERHKPKDILGEKEYLKDLAPAILLANSEAHRFAIAYHKKIRNRNFYK
jgi:excinuclease ABC subunit C